MVSHQYRKQNINVSYLSFWCQKIDCNVTTLIGLKYLYLCFEESFFFKFHYNNLTTSSDIIYILHNNKHNLYDHIRFILNLCLLLKINFQLGNLQI